MTSTGHEVGRRLACHLCKRSEAKQSEAVCEAKETTFVFANRLKLELKKERKWTPPPETSAEQSWVSHQADVVFVFFFLHKQDGRAVWRKFSDMLQPACDTNILQYVLRCFCFFFCLFFSFRYWTPVRRPALTHRLITCFLHIYKKSLKSKVFL